MQELEVEDKKLKEGGNQGVIIDDLQQKVQLLSLQEQRLKEQVSITKTIRNKTQSTFSYLKPKICEERS